MRILSFSTLRRFVEGLAGQRDKGAVGAALDQWYSTAVAAEWRSSADVRRSFATVSIVSAERLVFNIKGNDYRLVVAVDYEKQLMWVKWVGSHADYDRIDVRTVTYERPPDRDP